MALAAKSSMSLTVAKRPMRAVPRLSASRKLVVRASAEPTEPTSTPAANEYVQKVQTAATEAWTWVQDKWSKTEDSEKPAVVAIIVGVVLAQIAIGATIDVVDRIPIVNKVLQLVGLGVTSFYIFKIVTDVEEREYVKGSVSSFLDKVTGKPEDK